MPRVVSFLNDDLMKNLKELYKDSSKPLSKIVSELTDIGYKVKLHNKGQKSNSQEEKKAELVDKHTEYLLRIMAITADTYRCVRNEKSKYNEKDIDNVLGTIANNTQNYLREKLKKK